MTPSFMGLIAVILPGVRPSISLASMPTASMRPFTLFRATIDGSLRTMPLPRAKKQVLAVPRSMARSWEKWESRVANMVVPASGNADAVGYSFESAGNGWKYSPLGREPKHHVLQFRAAITALKVPDRHSERNATSGSTRVARHAGTSPAARA